MGVLAGEYGGLFAKSLALVVDLTRWLLLGGIWLEGPDYQMMEQQGIEKVEEYIQLE